MKGILYILFFFCSISYGQDLGFPTVLGGGAYSRGDVTYTHRIVTNLNGSGPGSFWDALQSNSIITFQVSGVISLDVFSTITVSNVIILGQTAPEGGITITGQRMRWQNCNNIIVRYINVRPSGTGNDAWEFIGCDNVILDHCGFSFGGDETVTFRGDTDNITFSRNIVSYGKTGSLAGDSNDYTISSNLSYISNVYTHVSHRLPNPNSNFRIDVIGNVFYHWFNLLSRTGGSVQLNYIGNYLKKGQPVSFYNQIDIPDNPSIYIAKNRLPGIIDADIDDNWVLNQDWNGGAKSTTVISTSYQSGTQFSLLNFGIDVPDGDQAYTDLIVNRNVGNNRYLDNSGVPHYYMATIDSVAIDNIESGTYQSWAGTAANYVNFTERINWLANVDPGTVVNTRTDDADGDNMPDTWETANGLNTSIDDSMSKTLDATYTNIEMFSFEVDATSSPSAGITFSPISGNTTEAGGTATFTIVLNALPTSSVVLDVTSQDTSEGTVSPSQLTFTTGNWNTPQTVTVTGVDDALNDGNITYNVTISVNDAASADEYDPLPDTNVSVVNLDNDVLPGSIIFTRTLKTSNGEAKVIHN